MLKFREDRVADTNVYIYDPNSVDILREDGCRLIVPMAVIFELDNLKDKPNKGIDARKALRKIREIQRTGDESLVIADHPKSNFFKGLDKNSRDHQIIATAKNFAQKNESKSLTLVSKDIGVLIVGSHLKLKVEDYTHDRVEVPQYQKPKTINLDGDGDKLESGRYGSGRKFFAYDAEKHGEVAENEGVVCYSESIDNGWKPFFALRKGDFFRSLPANINLSGIVPRSIEGNGPNWSQYFGMEQLLDPEIKLIFFQGGAGTGKTLLAIASAIAQRTCFRQIIVAHPMTHLEDKDNLGYLPGGLEEKMAPWRRPLEHALEVISKASGRNVYLPAPKSKKNGKNDVVEQVYDCRGNEIHPSKGKKNGKDKDKDNVVGKVLSNDGKLSFEPIDYIRGVTFTDTIIIVEEAQNLTPHQVKTIITRVGEGTKMIFTGDLGQIDTKTRIEPKSSGLAYGMARMSNKRLVGVTNFNDTVRSELARLAEECM